jgi:hypothetical protein
MERVMTLNLPPAISAYFEADKLDSEAVAQCFTPNAIVKDEGITYNGSNEIKRWKAETTTKYVYTSEPLATKVESGVNIVTGRVTGNFPGSPVDLRFFFRLENDRIAALEIIP